MRPPQAYSVLARRMGLGGAGATRERVACCASPSSSDPECVAAAYSRDWRLFFSPLPPLNLEARY